MPQLDVMKFYNYIDAENANGLIYAPTQVGKTEAIISFIEACFHRDTPVIVSSDNKLDQLDQLYRRVQRRLAGIEAHMMCVSDRKFETTLKNIVKSGCQRYVIFVMNNAVQINILNRAYCSIILSKLTCMPFKLTRKMAIVHDEADTHVKHWDVDNIQASQCAAHQAWINLVAIFQDNTQVLIKRMFVTATPEAVGMIYNIDNAMVYALKVPETYIGYGHKNFNYVDMPDNMNINDALAAEVNRINEAESCEIVLYCIERSIVQGQNVVMTILSEVLDCTINTYNGKGICVIFKTDEMTTKFTEMCGHYNERIDGTKKIIVKMAGNALNVTNLPISIFYTMCKAIGEKCIVTVGKDLIARGISYCSTDKVQPFAATTMFYRPGKTMHSVGICQAIGRITGTARPELERRVCAPADVILAYKAYNKNQKKYIDMVASEIDDISVKTIIYRNTFCRCPRKIDRPSLKLKMNMTYNYESDSEEDEDEDETEDETEDEDDNESEKSNIRNGLQKKATGQFQGPSGSELLVRFCEGHKGFIGGLNDFNTELAVVFKEEYEKLFDHKKVSGHSRPDIVVGSYTFQKLIKDGVIAVVPNDKRATYIVL
jgi:hypothetical protein